MKKDVLKMRIGRSLPTCDFGNMLRPATLAGPRPATTIRPTASFGANASRTLPISQYHGAGVTGFGLVGSRQLDSMGIGFGLSRLASPTLPGALMMTLRLTVLL